MTINDGFSYHHAGTVRLERHFARGFSVGGHWTWSKFLEAVERLSGQDLHPSVGGRGGGRVEYQRDLLLTERCSD